MILLDQLLPQLVKVEAKLVTKHLFLFHDVFLADQRVKECSHAERLPHFQLRVYHLIIELNRHLSFVFVRDGVVEGSDREVRHLLKLLL